MGKGEKKLHKDIIHHTCQMQVNFLSRIKSIQLYLHNIIFLQSPHNFPWTLVISRGPFSITIGIPKNINKEHIRLSTKYTCSSATFKRFAVGTNIKLQKPQDLCKRGRSLKAVLRLYLLRSSR